MPSPAIVGSHSIDQLNAATVGVPVGVIEITIVSPATTLVEVELVHEVAVFAIVQVVAESVPFLFIAIA